MEGTGRVSEMMRHEVQGCPRATAEHLGDFLFDARVRDRAFVHETVGGEYALGNVRREMRASAQVTPNSTKASRVVPFARAKESAAQR